MEWLMKAMTSRYIQAPADPRQVLSQSSASRRV
jgi:hypothetical protein